MHDHTDAQTDAYDGAEEGYCGLRLDDFTVEAESTNNGAERVLVPLKGGMRGTCVVTGVLRPLKFPENEHCWRVEFASKGTWMLSNVDAPESPFPTVFVPLDFTLSALGCRDVPPGVDFTSSPYIYFGKPSPSYAMIWDEFFHLQCFLARLLGDWILATHGTIIGDEPDWMRAGNFVSDLF